MESERMKRFKKAGLVGCLNNSGINSENYKDFIFQPERSKREDSCKHEWGSEEWSDSSDPFYICSKCGSEMRCSEHCGNTVREVQ